MIDIIGQLPFNTDFVLFFTHCCFMGLISVSHFIIKNYRLYKEQTYIYTYKKGSYYNVNGTIRVIFAQHYQN